MKRVLTKHGHEWHLPETLGEFQSKGISVDTICLYAGAYLRKIMEGRSILAARGDIVFNPSITVTPGGFRANPKARAEKLLKKTSPEVINALLEHLKEQAAKEAAKEVK